MISAVATLYKIHPQTLRLYERAGLLKPSRSHGNTRLYTDQDLERLEVILNFARNMGVNLAGIEIILNMRDKMNGRCSARWNNSSVHPARTGPGMRSADPRAPHEAIVYVGSRPRDSRPQVAAFFLMSAGGCDISEFRFD